jgi:hypothetical protein
MGAEAATISRALVEQIVREAVERRLGAGCPKKQPQGRSELVVHASARHVHLSRGDLEALFGPGHELTPEKPLLFFALPAGGFFSIALLMAFFNALERRAAKGKGAPAPKVAAGGAHG